MLDKESQEVAKTGGPGRTMLMTPKHLGRFLFNHHHHLDDEKGTMYYLASDIEALFKTLGLEVDTYWYALTEAEKAKGRSSHYHMMSPEEQWAEDKKLGILDWDGS